jgi:hypothetical protein
MTGDAQRERYEAQLFRRVHNPSLLAMPLVGALGAIAFGLLNPHFAALAAMLVVLSVTTTVRLARTNPNPRLEREEVTADAEGIRVGDLRIARAEVQQALLVPQRAAPPVVRLTRRRRLPVELVVPNAEEGRRLLRALGFDASQVTARFRTGSQLLAMPRSWRLGASWAIGLILILGTRLIPPSMIYLLPMLAVALVMAMAMPSAVEVGADGVMIRAPWGRRFVPMGSVSRVEAYDESYRNRSLHGVLLKLHDGGEVKIPVGARRGDETSAAALLERVREAVDTYRRGDVEGASALLDRGDRSVGDWITYLRSVGVGANVTLRSAPLLPERLWRIVESASAKPADRAAAAVALAATGEDRTRLRVAADAVVEPKLRVALATAANTDVDDEALGEALEELRAAH